jgi:hypothetical protein
VPKADITVGRPSPQGFSSLILNNRDEPTYEIVVKHSSAFDSFQSYDRPSGVEQELA